MFIFLWSYAQNIFLLHIVHVNAVKLFELKKCGIKGCHEKQGDKTGMTW